MLFVVLCVVVVVAYLRGRHLVFSVGCTFEGYMRPVGRRLRLPAGVWCVVWGCGLVCAAGTCCAAVCPAEAGLFVAEW
jgi:hypothetical protein